MKGGGGSDEGYGVKRMKIYKRGMKWTERRKEEMQYILKENLVRKLKRPNDQVLSEGQQVYWIMPKNVLHNVPESLLFL